VALSDTSVADTSAFLLSAIRCDLRQRAAQTATDIYLFLIREPESGLNLSRRPATIRDVRAEYRAAESPL